MIESTKKAWKMRVSECAQYDFVSMPYSSTMLEVAKAIISGNKQAAVISENDDVMGIISDTDIGRLAAMGLSLEEAHVEDYLTACMLTGSQPCIQIKENDLLIDALKVMENYSVGMILVINENNELVGTLTSFDALKGYIEEVYAPPQGNEGNAP